MNKNAIKKFAIEARNQLLDRVRERAIKYGITSTNTGNPDDDIVDGYILTNTEKSQRQALIKEIEEKSYVQVMEEIAYTWFNRFIALRFMEVNTYLPTRIRVFTNDTNQFKPQILEEAINLDMDGLDMKKVYDFKENNQDEELYKYLIITQCNALNEILPDMFQKISDYTELLFPDNLLREGSVIDQMISLIDEDDWKDAVQIIGWLYQYYNSEKKDQVFADLKKNIKVNKENIPAATQLFTPDWIVRYMVENSLGRLWQEGHPDRDLKAKWDYYVEEADQDEDVDKQLEEIRKTYKDLRPEEIKCIDPCSGSGHILVYMFDVLIDIYLSQGYTPRDAARSIVENNLYGLEIDDRAGQLSYFAIMMKARQYDRKFLNRKISPHVYVIEESNHIKEEILDYFINGDDDLKISIETIIEEFHDAKEYGAIIEVSNQDWDKLKTRVKEIEYDIDLQTTSTLKQITPLIRAGEVLAQKYDVVVTNPPYMGTGNMNSKLKEYLKKNYKDSKSDLFAVFIEKCMQMLDKNSFLAMITQHSWMFLTSYEKLRASILMDDIINMAHLGPRAFEEIGGEVVQTTSFVMRNSKIGDYKSIYSRLVDENSEQAKADAFLSGKNQYLTKQTNFTKIPGSPVAYWASEDLIKSFNNDILYAHSISPSQNVTGNNGKFIRMFWELSRDRIGNKNDWIFYCKGGGYRKWWGNLENVVNWTPGARKIYKYGDGNRASQIIKEEYWYKKGITWGLITSAIPSFRVMPEGATFDKGGSTILVEDDIYYFSIGMLNSKVYLQIASILNPTLNFQVKDVRSMPLVLENIENINKLVQENISLSKTDWDSFETSWDFDRHPLIRDVDSISEAFDLWQAECDERFNKLKANEEELNRIFIDIYGLNDELSPDVDDRDVTVARADLSRDIRSFISYAVGCMFGRYSLDEPGLIYAGGDWDSSKYISFKADEDNVLPISDDEYFKDDIVGRFIKFVEIVYGKEKLYENLEFIARALPGDGLAKDVIRSYFLNNFYADHLKTYQKRPIYWMFDSGKKNGFKCLIYMHRYEPDLLARIRTDYVHEHQSRYHTSITDLENRIENADSKDKIRLDNKLKDIKAQAKEILTYEEKIHHLADQMLDFDLDDGVKNNYEIFKDVLAKLR